jgi:type III pantothenate kinase
MDLIAMDIGNSAISLGVFAKKKLTKTRRFESNELDDLADEILAMKEMCTPNAEGVKTTPVVACSVNNKALKIAQEAVLTLLDQDILLAGKTFPLEMKMDVDSPESVGTDRLINAAAAFDVVQEPVVIADFGTATTMDCVDEQGVFLGGVILPGLKMSAQALHQNTALLPEVAIEVPDRAYAGDTIGAIQCGIYYGAQGALREISEQFASKLGRWPHVVATGGFCKIIAEKSEIIDSLVPDLCLNGLYLAFDRYLNSLDEDQDS